jgi:hypothetical protein
MRDLCASWLGCLALGLASCSSDPEPRACTAIGCIGGAYVSVVTGELADGDYRLRVDLDGSNYDCSLSAPDDLPDSGGQRLRCDAELRDSTIMARISCELGVCDPRDGFELSFRNAGYPETIAVTLERDATPLMSEERTLEDQQVYPNGAGCDAGCRAAEAKFQVE